MAFDIRRPHSGSNETSLKPKPLRDNDSVQAKQAGVSEQPIRASFPGMQIVHILVAAQQEMH
jgi:hypothetical protein